MPLPMLVPLVLTSNVPELMVVVVHPALPVALTSPNGDMATTIFPPPVMAPRFVSVADVLLGTDPLGKCNPTPATVRFPVNDTPLKNRPPACKWLKARVWLPDIVVGPAVVKSP